MGEVYRARDTKLNRDVALKVLPDSFANDPDRLARFQREAQVLASLNYPNIAHIHGLEDSGGVQALVMEHRLRAPSRIVRAQRNRAVNCYGLIDRARHWGPRASREGFSQIRRSRATDVTWSSREQSRRTSTSGWSTCSATAASTGRRAP